MIQEYYRQMRKFGCNILAVVQQYDIIQESPVRGAMIGTQRCLPPLDSTGKKVGFGKNWKDALARYKIVVFDKYRSIPTIGSDEGQRKVGGVLARTIYRKVCYPD